MMMKNMEIINNLDHEKQVIRRAIAKNNLIIHHLLNHQSNQAIYGGSVLGRSFIHRD